MVSTGWLVFTSDSNSVACWRSVTVKMGLVLLVLGGMPFKLGRRASGHLPGGTPTPRLA
ncbi:MAG: hypothetical protein ACREMN_02605 [Gemmatimonadales bacterium]